MSERSALLDVLNRRHPGRRPVWFMRQAGRYLPEYRAVRERFGSFLKLCYNPELAAEVTSQPLRRFDLDAAIVFADILVVPHAMGVDLTFAENEGPVLESISGDERVKRLRTVADSFQMTCVAETISRVRASLDPGVALIGLCGAPWTVASYMIGGKGPDSRDRARAIALAQPPWLAALIDRLVAESITYLLGQAEAGAQVLQIFDSWAGEVPFYAQRALVAEPIAQIVANVKKKHPNIPIIVFAKGAGVGHQMIAETTQADGIGVESSLCLDWARKNLPSGCAIQGNLDPVILEAGGNALEEGIARITASVPMDTHIFNLGHGIRPMTPPDHLARTIELVREADKARGL